MEPSTHPLTPGPPIECLKATNLWFLLLDKNRHYRKSYKKAYKVLTRDTIGKLDSYSVMTTIRDCSPGKLEVGAIGIRYSPVRCLLCTINNNDDDDDSI